MEKRLQVLPLPKRESSESLGGKPSQITRKTEHSDSTRWHSDSTIDRKPLIWFSFPIRDFQWIIGARLAD
ncbi:hypothetical protein [Rhizobium alvei]|uniref:Uncharacterized protein n=1 Tax=Rhizobium alvei TaxID=1132659 RepID=A0ABT8YW03_9HYPH|nr:hypothetical protein [Rhizobium alvei]MDO6967105.1 hypothetical protein [Rhizobium alvei]